MKTLLISYILLQLFGSVVMICSKKPPSQPAWVLPFRVFLLMVECALIVMLATWQTS